MKKERYNIFTIFLIAIVFASCSKDDTDIGNEVTYSEAKTILNVAYGSDPEQKADVYLPAGRSNKSTKVVVLLHGGGWVGGDKKDMGLVVQKVQTQFKEYAAVNMNYRLARFNRPALPTQMDDIHMLLDFISGKSSEYGVQPEFILFGISAGGHLSMLYAYKYDKAHRVKAVANLVGPSNLADEYYKTNFVFNIGVESLIDSSILPSGMSKAVFGSPITWISPTSAPTISLFGTKDDLVPPSQKTALDAKLKQFNVANESYSFNGGHDIGLTYTDDIIAKIQQFLSVHAK